MLVMDVSGSMQANDLQPTRMEAAKQAAHALVDSLPDQMQTGLISFSSASSVAAPLTRDHTLVHRAINSLFANGGTAIGEGLNSALDQLAQRPTDAQGNQGPAVVVLLSDGANAAGRSPDQAAQKALDAGVKVYTVGIGQRGARPTVQGGQRVDLDETTLQRIANITGADYFYAAETTQLEKVYADLGSMVSWEEEKTEVTAFFSAAGAVLLLIGGALSLLWFARLP
jgi:Ca-activated chloride channel family protein